MISQCFLEANKKCGGKKLFLSGYQFKIEDNRDISNSIQLSHSFNDPQKGNEASWKDYYNLPTIPQHFSMCSFQVLISQWNDEGAQEHHTDIMGLIYNRVRNNPLLRLIVPSCLCMLFCASGTEEHVAIQVNFSSQCSPLILKQLTC